MKLLPDTGVNMAVSLQDFPQCLCLSEIIRMQLFQKSDCGEWSDRRNLLRRRIQISDDATGDEGTNAATVDFVLCSITAAVYEQYVSYAQLFYRFIGWLCSGIVPCDIRQMLCEIHTV